ncbi:gamma-glutamyl-gamma-aminobutyrate hydrolase family protein [Paracoccus sp. TOH]|uniref:gamma-glutamyl-gamma-aminobutyrate hydrolase family protein n=1 Tax=Paracoccus sp. TOH TaxID=1263728 RepID=UPI0025B256E9|nr:gamma-glutamyl-gamma-aminobutyrate hydrolase family protein [Paracoccus sp. TOH]WJS87120.1 gamma-glutamyl-gamma-aminobutyrate hydrolase family protein [Paracoccus sp. TOH]
MSALPSIALIGDVKDIAGMPYHVVGDKYVRSIRDYAGAMPFLVLPPLDAAEIDLITDRFDGFMFTGSASNIHPSHWNGPADTPGPFDEIRDELALLLVRTVVEKQVPALFICRGFQELNVGLGGTLEPELKRLPSRIEHHAPEHAPLEELYGPFHDMELSENSPLIQVFGTRRFAVNSLHYQGLADIAPRLHVEGTAPDGTPEAVRVVDHPFAIGVQWHAEYRPDLSPPNARLLAAFGTAARDRRQAR